MPSGYTADIYEGKEVSPREFLSKFARNFGLYFHMRDVDFKKELQPPPKDHYYYDCLREARDDLSWFTLLRENPSKAEDEYNRQREKHDDDRRKEVQKKVRLRRRYDKMINAISELDVPKDDSDFFQKYISGAIEHLKESRDSDARPFRQPTWLEIYPTVDAWIDLNIENAQKNIQRYQLNIVEAERHYEERLALHNRLTEFLAEVDSRPVV